MKVALLSGANSIHTIRWANGLCSKNLNVHVISIHPIDNNQVRFDDRVKVHILHFAPPFGYFLAIKELRNLLTSIQPDILNAHYASGYGTMAAISGFHPLLLSLWGSDVFIFPKKSIFHKMLLKRNMKKADGIASTSNCMALEAKNIYPHSKVFITPFGIDHNIFKNFENDNYINNRSNEIIIGTVKSLKHIYGIDILIKSFAAVKNMTDIKIKLVIYGDGPERLNLEKIISELEIQEEVKLLGSIEHSQVPEALNKMDIFTALSRSESFGVAVLEASSCGLPVVVSDAEGLKEVVIDGVTGFVTPIENIEENVKCLLKLIENDGLRATLGENGRKQVKENFSWEFSLTNMISVYSNIIEKYSNNN